MNQNYPQEHLLMVFKTKLIRDNLYFCYCNFKSGQKNIYVKKIFSNATNICKADFKLKDVDKYFPKLILQTNRQTNRQTEILNQIAIPVVQKKQNFVFSISGEELTNYEIFCKVKEQIGNSCYINDIKNDYMEKLINLPSLYLVSDPKDEEPI